jgi:frataxin-like iron-binding protein CyaY
MEALTEALRQYRDLHKLRQHWISDEGHAAYRFRVEDGKWLATRTDDGRELSVVSAFELRVAVANDYASSPVRRKGEL